MGTVKTVWLGRIVSSLRMAVLAAMAGMVALMGMGQSAAAQAMRFDAQRAGFSIRFDGYESNLDVISTSVMPGAVLTILPSRPVSAHIEVSAQAQASTDANGGTLTQEGRTWRWSAPDHPGHSILKFSNEGEDITLNVFVLKPVKTAFHHKIGGYKLGHYVQAPFRGRTAYAPPIGFIEVNKDMLDIQVSPHFTLGQFLCKQQPNSEPKYVLLQTPLLMKLERLLDTVNAAGHRADSFHIMSGFRTPWYNAAIGNTTRVSRHLYGDAADIFIDNDGDNMMDDLNADGKIDRKDGQVLKALADLMAAEGKNDWTPGGLSAYKANSRHGPFVHVDTRGYAARW